MNVPPGERKRGHSELFILDVTSSVPSVGLFATAAREGAVGSRSQIRRKHMPRMIHVLRVHGDHVFRTPDLLNDALLSAHAGSLEQLQEPVRSALHSNDVKFLVLHEDS